MKVIKVEPKKEPYVVDIENTLESLQKEVDGYIEILYPFDERVCIVCNEEGKIRNLAPNRTIMKDGYMMDVIVGTFLIAKFKGSDFVSLSEKECEKYMKLFPVEFA